MRKISFTMCVVCVAMALAGCGSSSTSTGATAGGVAEAGAGVASVESLSSIPTMDLSSYDSSSSSNANLSALMSASKSISKGIGENLNAVGNASRAGCEANMHKQEVIRISQQVQLDRCYIEAMETGGLITIPNESYTLLRLTPPEETQADREQQCEEIPSERVDEKAACLAGNEGPGGQMLIRVGRFSGNELRIDICEGSALSNESTYTASGDQYTVVATRSGQWGGHSESGNFNVTVDLGATGTVTDGVVTVGTDGSVIAAGQMIGGFGSGTIGFELVGADSSIKVYGAFAGGFEDDFSGTTASFTGKAYARLTNAGCAKYSFTGSMPAIRVQDIVPFNISAAELSDFLQALGIELGINITAENYETLLLCPNPDFDPDVSNSALSMIALAGGTASCEAVTDTGVECFGITNGASAGNFGEDIITQTFTVVANSASAYYDEVNAFDLATLDDPPTAIAFARNWDCSGPYTDVNFSGVDPIVMESAIQECQAIEEKARGNDGMGGYNCGQQEQMNGVNDFAEEGGGSAAFGVFGGQYLRSAGGTCPEGAGLPQMLFINGVNPDQNEYCLGLEGACEPFTIEGKDAMPAQAIDVGNGITLTEINFAKLEGAPPTGGTVTFGGVPGGTCTAEYTAELPEEFGSQSGFGGAGADDGTLRPGDAGFTPQPCIDAGLTGADQAGACMQLCMQPGVECRPDAS